MKMKLMYSFFVCSFEVAVINHESNSFWLLSPFLFACSGLLQTKLSKIMHSNIYLLYVPLSFIGDFFRSILISIRQNEYVKERFFLPDTPFLLFPFRLLVVLGFLYRFRKSVIWCFPISNTLFYLTMNQKNKNKIGKTHK